MTPSGSIFARFLTRALVVTTLLLLAGYLPTLKLGGTEAVRGMVTGCAIGLVASLAGAVPVLLVRGLRTTEAVPFAMIALGARLAVALGLGIAAAMSGLFVPKPLLAWVAISHAGLSIPDTLLSIEVLARNVPPEES